MRRVRKVSPILTLTVVLLLALAYTLTQPTRALEITGRVVGITDGDTLTLLDTDRHQVRIRLASIDAPEHNQPYGYRAKQALSDLVFGRDVRVVVVDRDRYGRTVGRIYVGTLDVNAELVRMGAVWVYTRFNRDPSLLVLQAEALAAHRGLWALPESERMPPWEWRAEERSR